MHTLHATHTSMTLYVHVRVSSTHTFQLKNTHITHSDLTITEPLLCYEPYASPSKYSLNSDSVYETMSHNEDSTTEDSPPKTRNTRPKKTHSALHKRFHGDIGVLNGLSLSDDSEEEVDFRSSSRVRSKFRPATRLKRRKMLTFDSD